MCDFAEPKEFIEAYEEEEILVVGDPDQKYGELFLLCVTNEARDVMLDKVMAKEREEEAQRKAEEEEEARRKAEELAYLTAEYDDKPLVPGSWEVVDEGSADEVQALSILPSRPLIKIDVTRTIGSIRSEYIFHERNSEITGVVSFRSHKEKTVDILLSTSSIQFASATKEEGIQAGGNRKNDQCTSCEGVGVDPINGGGNEGEKILFVTPQNQTGDRDNQHASTPNVGGGGRKGNVHQNRQQPGQQHYHQQNGGGGGDGDGGHSTGKRNTGIDDPGFLDFLERTTCEVEKAMQQNESTNIFEDYFAKIKEEERGSSGISIGGEENILHEALNFGDPQFSKNLSISHINWLPNSSNMLAVLPSRNTNFDTRLHVSGHAFSTHILIWHFGQLVKPHMILQSPHELSCFHFNPDQSNLVVGGCTTGQVVVWDISQTIGSSSRNKKRSQSQGNSGGVVDDEGHVQIVRPFLVSNIDHNHKKIVKDIQWLAIDSQVNFKGNLLESVGNESYSSQFISSSEDGSVMIWDLRFKEIAKGELMKVGRPKIIPVDKHSPKDSHGNPNCVFGPIRKIHIKRIEGVGEMTLCTLCCNMHLVSDSLGDGEEDEGGINPNLELFLSTAEGDIVHATIGKSVALSTKNTSDDDDGDGGGIPDFVYWMGRDHSSPPLSLQQSPFFSDIILSVSAWKFQIWKKGIPQPLFTSPTLSSLSYTCGRWSPSKPTILLLGASDGSVKVWDFTDSTCNSSIDMKATHTAICSMEFLILPVSSTSAMRQQLLAIGDTTGTLHVYEVPKNLFRPLHNEVNLMSQFLSHQISKLGYVTDRSKIRKDEAENEDEEHEEKELEPLEDGGDEAGLGSGGTMEGGMEEEEKKTEERFELLMKEFSDSI